MCGSCFRQPGRSSFSPPKRALNFLADLASLPARNATSWNRTWIKKNAQILATTAINGETIPLAGIWPLGTGRVAATGFLPNATERSRLSNLLSRPPRDPRFTVSWGIDSRLTVRVDAASDKAAINGLNLRLEITPDEGLKKPANFIIGQTAPGRYEWVGDALRLRSFASVYRDAQLLDRVALPARYAPEFDAVGNDYEAMSALARQTGGKVIDGNQKKAIEFEFSARPLSLAPILCGVGTLFLLGGLAVWRLGY